jgi:hypothetical protein
MLTSAVLLFFVQASKGPIALPEGRSWQLIDCSVSGSQLVCGSCLS